MCTKGAFINTLVGWGLEIKVGGIKKVFYLKKGVKKVQTLKRGGQKSFDHPYTQKNQRYARITNKFANAFYYTQKCF